MTTHTTVTWMQSDNAGWRAAVESSDWGVVYVSPLLSTPQPGAKILTDEIDIAYFEAHIPKESTS